MVCPFDLKKSRNDWRISALVMGLLVKNVASCQAEGGRVGGRWLAFT